MKKFINLIFDRMRECCGFGTCCGFCGSMTTIRTIHFLTPEQGT